MKQRMKWIDIAKGICMISVVLGHLGVSQLGFVYSYHLTTFFILAGYTLKKEDITEKYLKNKFERLMTPYFFTCFAVVVMEVVNLIIIYRSFSIKAVTNLIYVDIVRSFFASGTFQTMGSVEMGRFIGAIWFLPAMFFALLFVQVVLKCFTEWKYRWVLAILLAGIGCITSKIIWLPFSMQVAMLAIPFILFGYWLKTYEVLEKMTWKVYSICLIVFVTGCITGYAQVFYMVTCSMKDWFITPLCAIASSLLVIGLARIIEKCKAIEFWGRNSLIILCVHLFEMNTLSRYYSFSRKVLSIPENRWIHLMMEMIVINLLTSIITKWQSNKLGVQKGYINNSRDNALDILRAILIIMMILGYACIDGGMSRLIYSCHMLAFVMISGYFYNDKISLKNKMKKNLKTLMPYIIFSVLYIAVRHDGFACEIKNILMGISLSNKLFNNSTSIGPIYFVLLLVAVRMIYSIIDELENKWWKNIIIIFLFLVGVVLGEKGIWLFWSLDAAFFALLFYHIAYYLRKYNILEWCLKNPWLYFILSPIWAYMIYDGAMEIALRRYGNIGITIMGVTASFVLLYYLCTYISNNMPRAINNLMSLIGQSTAYILIIHTIFEKEISKFVGETLQLNIENIFYLITMIIIQISLGIIVQIIFSKIKRNIKNETKIYIQKQL